jgi:two-component system cell cycle sensor histidine kinase/response regulator CckA
VAERILRRAGYDVRSSPDGRHALEAIEAGDDIDLVISDVVMPGMGGLELFRLVEDRPGCPRFLFMSGYSSLDELGKSDVRGLRFLRKPWGAHELLQAVRDALDEPAAGAVSGAAAPNLLW